MLMDSNKHQSLSGEPAKISKKVGALLSRPEAGAVCGKATRTDLGGGREVTRVPTAKRRNRKLLHCSRGPLLALSGRAGHVRLESAIGRQTGLLDMLVLMHFRTDPLRT